MVEMDSNVILVEPLESQTVPELTRVHLSMMLKPKWAGIVPRKHVLDNKISGAMKDKIWEEYDMEMAWYHQDVTEETQQRL